MCGQMQTGGMWSPKERRAPINLLELKAAFFALQIFGPNKTNMHALLLIDNTTAIAYINCKGPIWEPSPADNSGPYANGRLADLMSQWEETQLSEQALQLISASWRPNTEKTYLSAWRRWIIGVLQNRQIPFHQPSLQ